ncbi:molybdate transport repressor ModE-like protein [Mycobacterium sp. MAA66]
MTIEPLSARMPELSTLEIFLAVARTGSLSAAGREFGLSQQAVSARIASLEAQTAVQLVTRTPRGSRLTPSGTVLAEWAARLIEVAQQVDAGLATLRAEKRRRVKVAASLTVAEYFMPRWLVSMQAEARLRGTTPTEVILTATNSDHVVAAVRDTTADLGFIETPRVPSDVKSCVVAHDELVVVVQPTHKWAKRKAPLTPAELNQTSLVTREAGSGTRDALTTALHKALGASTPQPDPVLELASAAAVRAAVIAGAGPAVMSYLTVADDVDIGRLHLVATSGLDLHRELRAIWTGGRTPPAGAVRDLLSHITTHSRRSGPNPPRKTAGLKPGRNP